MNNDLSTKIVMAFAITAQVVFVVMFFAYCLYPVWAPLVFKR